MPGEELICKMWDSLIASGVGSIAAPWRIKREGKAHLEIRRQELLMLAQTEQDINAIRNGQKHLLADGRLIDTPDSYKNESQTRIEPTITLSNLANTTHSKKIAREIQEEININKIIITAEQQLTNDSQEPPTQNIDGDWLFRWQESARKISSDDLQKLWAKALSGETKKPGTYSLRTIDFLKNISQAEAQKIELIAPFAIDDCIIKDQVLEQYGIDFNLLLELEELGILTGVDGGGLKRQFYSINKEDYTNYIFYKNKSLIIKDPSPEKKLTLSCYKVTQIGTEIIQLGEFAHIQEYITSVANQIKSSGFNVSIADCELKDSMYNISNPVDL